MRALRTSIARHRSRIALAAGVALTSALPRSAFADPAACATNAENGQAERESAKLVQAKRTFTACAAAECPSYIRKDCTRWLDDVEASIPTVVIRASDDKGNDIYEGDVTISIDGNPRDEKASSGFGLAIALDPGPHKLRVKLGALEGEQKILAAIGEKNRILKIVLTPPASARVPASAAAGAHVPPPKDESAARAGAGAHGPWPWVVGGFGVASLAVFGGLQLSAQSRYDDLRSSCGHSCAKDDVDGVRTRVIVSGVALGVGLVALGAAAWLWFAAPGGHAPTSSTSATR